MRVVRFVRTVPHDQESATIGQQVLRSGTSVSANYHAACRARSRAEFIAKLGIVLEEADETEHWLDLLRQSGLASGVELNLLRAESGELRAIFKSSVDTARRNYAALQKSSNKS